MRQLSAGRIRCGFNHLNVVRTDFATIHSAHEAEGSIEQAGRLGQFRSNVGVLVFCLFLGCPFRVFWKPKGTAAAFMIMCASVRLSRGPPRTKKKNQGNQQTTRWCSFHIFGCSTPLADLQESGGSLQQKFSSGRADLLSAECPVESSKKGVGDRFSLQIRMKPTTRSPKSRFLCTVPALLWQGFPHADLSIACSRCAQARFGGIGPEGETSSLWSGGNQFLFGFVFFEGTPPK